MIPSVAVFSSGENVGLCDELVMLWGSKVRAKIWNTDIFNAGDMTADAILRTAKEVDFAVCLMTPDDEVTCRDETYMVPRDNVIMEYGLCCGVLGGSRAILLVDDTANLKLPTNVSGITQVRFEPDNIGVAARKLLKHFQDLGKIGSVVDPFSRHPVPGKRLFQHKGYYPIKLSGEHEPSLDPEIYRKALNYLLNDVDDQLAALDLAYLRYDNLGHTIDPLPDDAHGKFDQLVERYALKDFFGHFKARQDEIFGNFIRLTNELGDTFSGVHCEFLLHNVMNPLRSIIAAKNTTGISERPLYGPSTRFVVQFVRAQGVDLMNAMQQGGKIAYYKQFNKTKNVKATTTPFYDPKFGLVAILCTNVDIDAIEAFDDAASEKFFKNYTANTGVTPDFEKDIADSLKEQKMSRAKSSAARRDPENAR